MSGSSDVVENEVYDEDEEYDFGKTQKTPIDGDAGNLMPPPDDAASDDLF